MKTTMVIEKPAAARRTPERLRTAQDTVRSAQLPQALVADEQQVAEIERTFSVRWEW